MSHPRYELVSFAVILPLVLMTVVGGEPVPTSHPRNLYESHVDLSEDEVCSIQAHLEHVARLLLERDTAGMSSELRRARLLNLERLREYAGRGIFPRNRRFRGDLVPHFIDGRGRACAVGHLMIESGAGDLAREIARKANFGFLPEIDDPEAERWIEESGLTAEECAMIQPTYGRWWPVRFIEMGLDREGATRPGPIRVSINQFDTVGLGRPTEYVETIRGPVDADHVTADSRAVIENLPSENGGAQGVTIRRPANDAEIEMLWEIEYELDVDSGSFTFEGEIYYGSTRPIRTTGDTHVEVGPIPTTLGPFTGGPIEWARSIGPDCPGSMVEETVPGSYLLRAHGKPLVTEQSTFEFQSDGLLLAYKEVLGDFTFAVSLPEGFTRGARGCMVRESLDRRSPYVFLGERIDEDEVAYFSRWAHPEEFRNYYLPDMDPEEIHEVRDPRLGGGTFRTLRLERRDRRISASVLDEAGHTGEPGSWVEIEVPYEAWWHGAPYRLLVGIAATSEEGCALTTAAFTDVTLEEGPPYEIFRRGDVEPDGKLLISDPIRTLGFLFLGDAPPPCPDAADWNNDGKIDLSDPVGVLGWLFLGGSGSYIECDIDWNDEDPPLPACVYPQDTCR